VTHSQFLEVPPGDNQADANILVTERSRRNTLQSNRNNVTGENTLRRNPLHYSALWRPSKRKKMTTQARVKYQGGAGGSC